MIRKCLAIFFAGLLIGWLMVAGWTRQDAADVCSFFGYGSELEYAINPVGMCLIDAGDTVVRVKVQDVYRKYIRELNRRKKYQRGA